MADGDSVGTISLDLDLQSDIGKQIGEAASKIGDQIKASLEGLNNLNFKGLADTIAGTIKKSIDDSMKNVQSSIEKSLNNAMNKARSSVKGIKIPISFGTPTNSEIPKQNIRMSTASPRAPPIPKIDTGVNMEAVKAQIDNLARSLDITNAKIEQQKVKLAGLKESYAMAFDGTRKNKLEEEILKTETTINRLTATSDKAGFKLADLDKQFAMLSSTAKSATAGVNAANESIDRTARVATKSSGDFKQFGRSARESGDSFNGFNRSISLGLSTMLKWGIVFPIIYKGISTLGSFLGSALMINSQFANSLMEIKSNLMTAFMPIYQAVLPALNTLMSALATVTAYIASFISALFGKTYQASFGAAKSLQSSIGAYNQTQKAADKAADSLGDVAKKSTAAGDAAKKAGEKAKAGLMGFDEINQLQLNKNASTENPKTPSGKTDPGSGVSAPVIGMPNMAPIETATAAWAENFKKILAGLWTPFKEAWAAQGVNTINAAKYALQGIENLIGSIGKSFYTVWTNGTGTVILENFLKILQQMLLIIGDIGNTFANAWNKGNIGTQIIQSLANSLNNVLELIYKMEGSVRLVFAEEGPKFANLFMEALKGTTGVIENVTEKLGWIWDHGGQHAFEGLVKLGLKVGEIALFIYNQFVLPFVNWFVDMISPAIATVLDWIGSLADKMSGLIDWLMSSGEPVLATIVKGVGSVFLAFKTWQGISSIVKGVIGIVSKIKDGLGTVYLKVLSVGSNIINIIKSIGPKIIDVVKSIGSGIVNVIGTVSGGLKSLWKVMLSNPISIVIVAIAALTAGLVILYNKNAAFRTSINNTWTEAKASFSNAASVITSPFQKAIPAIDLCKGKISEATKKSINDFESLKTGVSQKLMTLKATGTVITQTTASSIEGSFNNMTKKINAGFEQHKQQQLKELQDLSQKRGLMTTQEYNDAVTKVTQKYTDEEKITTDGNTKIQAILNDAANQHRNLTQSEYNQINQIQETMQNQGIKALSKNEQEQRVIFENLKDQHSNISAQEAAAVVKNSKKTTDGVIKDANEQYDKTVAEIIHQRDDVGSISSDQAAKMIAKAKEQKDKTIKNAVEMHTKIVAEAKVQAGEHAKQVDWETGQVKTKWQVMKDDVSTKMEGLKQDLENKWEYLKNIIPQKVEDMKAAVEKKWQDLKYNVVQVAKDIVNGIARPINEFIDYWNSIKLTVPSVNVMGKKIDGFSIGLPHVNNIPYLARGGIIDEPTLAMVGESGKEAVVPLENTEFVDTLASAVANAMLSIAKFTNGNSNNNVSNQKSGDIILQIDGKTIARVLSPLLDNEKQRLGNRMIIKTV